ncbi:MAG: 2-amino-4-hydroxy-6-hydroxymethyldihydropteridine diphosphokinase [Lachnospiraceae bacterium]|nr:2-amino-4-hydroxy-6-hydroxymethyldihydropteridine diphosphokinase [Lachnospiraceae bacterium]
MDHIIIENLEVFGNHGVYAEEKKLGQKFLVSARLYLDLRTAGQCDDLESTVHYGKVSALIYDHMRQHSYQLIEAAAENIAKDILLKFNMVKKVELKIQKPWAPIGLPLEAVAVCIERGWHSVYLGMGSNMGDREDYLNSAIAAIDKRDDTFIGSISEYVESKPYKGMDQEDYLNGVCHIKTLMTPEELLLFLNETENEMGRERTTHWGARTLDLDILLYDDLVMDTEQLTIPHPELHKRDFVLVPICEIAPRLRHPVFNKTMSDLLLELKDRYVIE